MSSRIFTQDTTALVLIHNYEPTRCMLLALDRIKEFSHIVDENLEKINSKVNIIYLLDYSRLTYFTSFDEKDNEYCILKPDFDEEQTRINYIYRALYDAIKISKMKNALEELRL